VARKTKEKAGALIDFASGRAVVAVEGAKNNIV
jgi:hypothetical protein